MSRAAAPGQRTILALHGFWGAPGDFSSLESAVGPLQLRWECPQLPGHAEEPLPAECNGIEVLATWCEKKLSSKGSAQPSILLGYSLGARIALAVAARKKIEIAGLVLLSGSPGLLDPAQQQERAQLDSRRADELRKCTSRQLLHKFLLCWWEQAVFASPAWTSGCFAPFVEGRLGEDPTKLAAILEQASPGLQRPLWDRLPDISCPVLCIAGEADAKFSRIAHAMSEKLPRATTCIIPGAGHSLLLENPPSLAMTLHNWLKNVGN